MSETGWAVILFIVCAMVFLAIGLAIGVEIGSDSIAQKWCAAEGYGEGHYKYSEGLSRGGEKRVVCSHAKPILANEE